jgi:hypothetical protein
MKLVFGLIGAALVLAFLVSILMKVPDKALIVVSLIGVVMMLVDLWQARHEADT